MTDTLDPKAPRLGVLSSTEIGEPAIYTAVGWQALRGRDLRQSTLTHTGRYFWPLEPHPDEVDPEDIAWGLAHECRFSGQTPYHYSVAWHCIALMQAVPDHLMKWALVHDASEAYLKDIPRPIKALIPNYKEFESRLMIAVAERLGMDPLIEPEELKPYDYAMGHAEMCVLFPEGEGKLLALGRTDKYLEEIAPYRKYVMEVEASDAFGMWMHSYRALFGSTT